MGAILKEVGWRQLDTINIDATTPATIITIPLANYRTYCLAIAAVDGVSLVTEAGETISGMLTTSANTKLYGVFAKTVQLYAYAAVPTPIVVTPFVQVSGEVSGLPLEFLDPAVPWSVYEQAEYTAIPDYGTNYDTVYRTRVVAASNFYNFNFHVPADFSALVSIHADYFGSAGAAGAGKDIDLESKYCLQGQASNFNNEVDVASTYTLVGAGVRGLLDLSSVFSALQAGHVCGVRITQGVIGGALDYTRLVLRYIRRRTPS